jgi:hypothetical protein
MMIMDPPEGWRYGFPKPVPDGYIKNESLMRLWLQHQGYPCDQIDIALKHSRYWEKK